MLQKDKTMGSSQTDILSSNLEHLKVLKYNNYEQNQYSRATLAGGNHRNELVVTYTHTLAI